MIILDCTTGSRKTHINPRLILILDCPLCSAIVDGFQYSSSRLSANLIASQGNG